MPDRTQTLSVGENKAVQTLLGEAIDVLAGEGSNTGYRERLETARSKLRSALSQPEHQGDEARVSAVVDFLVSWRFCPVATASNPSRSCLEDAAKQLLAALPAQPPAPALSDEERERLEYMARIFDGLAADARQAGACSMAKAREGQATLLRKLASQEHRGEETFNAWLKRVRSKQPSSEILRTGDLDGGDAVEAVRRVLAGHLEGLWLGSGMVDLALAEAVSVLRPRIEGLAPTGEVERPRELVGRDMPRTAGLLCEAATDLSDYAAERDDSDDERRLLTMSEQLRTLDAALANGGSVGAGAAPPEARVGFPRGPGTVATPPASVDPAPSDSQGDQERCDGSGNDCRGCSACRPELIREEADRG